MEEKNENKQIQGALDARIRQKQDSSWNANQMS